MQRDIKASTRLAVSPAAHLGPVERYQVYADAIAAFAAGTTGGKPAGPVTGPGRRRAPASRRRGAGTHRAIEKTPDPLPANRCAGRRAPGAPRGSAADRCRRRPAVSARLARSSAAVAAARSRRRSPQRQPRQRRPGQPAASSSTTFASPAQTSTAPSHAGEALPAGQQLLGGDGEGEAGDPRRGSSTPPTKSSAISAQQQPRQNRPWPSAHAPGAPGGARAPARRARNAGGRAAAATRQALLERQ